jgi:regulator of protease activity HflC (stomatin/prohibitin superfamily)
LSLTRLRSVLEFDPSEMEDERQVAKVMAEQRQAAATLLSAGVRVDEARFKAEAVDQVGRILEEVKAEAARLNRPPPPPRELSYADLV